ncbi:hypothetical protein RHMOL_Rhmol12G0098100 [Rhododendron molle]|uniref:Uncharacterized protein n=1 Tax=Rhododendron molle TaxID=49168 RepID=A0ACC0LHV8_RHOML|nr:hypothetical protein RHMOL_Rhmol12G0098100 [Rhododendron molle]
MVWVMKTGKKQGDYQLGNSHIKPGGNGDRVDPSCCNKFEAPGKLNAGVEAREITLWMSVALNGENRLKDVANDKGASLASISTGKCGYAELEDHTEVQVVTGEEGCEGSNHYDVLPDDLGVGMTDPDGLKLYWRPWLPWGTVVRRLPMLELKLLELGRGLGTLGFWIWDML